jgi:hypothetical protein
VRQDYVSMAKQTDSGLGAQVHAIFEEYKAQERIPLTVYHYTSLTALIDIVQTGVLRVSNMRFSNDPAEVTYGHRLIQEVLAESFPDLTFGGVFDVINEIDYYAVCFSAEGDALQQWRAYCSNGRGIALGFGSEVFVRHPKLQFGRVAYQRTKQKELVRKIIEVYAPDIRQYERDEEKSGILIGELAGVFVQLAGFLKDEAYGTEREYRAFTTQPRSRQYHQYPVKFRATSGSVVPYLEFAFSVEGVAQPITEIIIGPCLDASLTKPSIEAFLEQVLTDPPVVSQSNVKMRG